MTTFAPPGEFDLADEHSVARKPDADVHPDSAAPESRRRVPDADDLPDRIDQAWINQYASDDDYYCLAY